MTGSAARPPLQPSSPSARGSCRDRSPKAAPAECSPCPRPGCGFQGLPSAVTVAVQTPQPWQPLAQGRGFASTVGSRALPTPSPRWGQVMKPERLTWIFLPGLKGRAREGSCEAAPVPGLLLAVPRVPVQGGVLSPHPISQQLQTPLRWGHAGHGHHSSLNPSGLYPAPLAPLGQVLPWCHKPRGAAGHTDTPHWQSKVTQR